MPADVAADLAATAVRAGRLRPEVTVDDLLGLANGIAMQAQDDPVTATRLLWPAVTGIEP